MDELRIRFLPINFSPNGSYSSVELDNARAFRVLVHAELEHFLEERAIDIANRAFNLLRTRSKTSRPIVHLLSNMAGKNEGLPSKLGTQTTPLSIAGKVLAQYKHDIVNNHGIRISNILRILLPIGVQEADLDAAWLSTTDGFSAKRGITAHASSIAYTIDPQDDHNVVSQIMLGVKDIDILLNSIRSKLRGDEYQGDLSPQKIPSPQAMKR